MRWGLITRPIWSPIWCRMAARVLGWGFEGRPAVVRLADVYAIQDDGSPGGEPFKALVGRDSKRVYQLGRPAGRPLFEELGRLSPDDVSRDPAPLVPFASTWGFLGSKLEQFSLAPDEYKPEPLGAFGERVEFWVFNIRRLRDALDLKRAHDQNDTRALANLVEIRERLGERVAFFRGATVQNLGKDGAGPFEWKNTERSLSFNVALASGGPRAGAFRILLALIEQSLGSVRLGLEADKRSPSGVAVVGRPSSTLEAAWTQLASHVAHGDSVRRCPECGKLFTDERDKPGPAQELCGRSCVKKRSRSRSAAKIRRTRRRKPS